MMTTTYNGYLIDFPKPFKDDISFIEKIGQSMIFRSGKYVLIARESTIFNSFELEKKRRIKAVRIAQSTIPSLVLKTNFLTVEAKQNKTKKLLMVRVVPWLNNVREVRKAFTLSQSIQNNDVSKAIMKVYRFVFLQYLRNKKMFDLFTLFEEFKDKNLMNLLVSNNIMIGTEPETRKEVIFIDPDWYFKVTDTKLTGFTKASYTKRVMEGLFLCLLGYCLFFCGRQLKLLLKKIN